MLAEQTHLKLVTDLTENETALVELNTADVDDVSGAVIPLVVIGALKIAGAVVGTAAVGAGVGYGIGYWANRD